VKFDGLGPIANRFYETLQRGRANLPKPVDCHQITDCQKTEAIFGNGHQWRHRRKLPTTPFPVNFRAGDSGAL